MPRTATIEDTKIALLKERCALKETSIQNILKLLEGGATIPFIARYRKEMTGGATDEELREFESALQKINRLLERKEEVLRLIEEKGKLTADIRKEIHAADTLTRLEDIYRPYKEKKNTRAGMAIQRGLEPLADLLAKGNFSLEELREKAREFVKGEVLSVDEAIRGAQDILAERYSDDPTVRERVRNVARKSGMLHVKAGKSSSGDDDGDTHFARLAERPERITSIPSHRYLAIMRGIREKKIQAKIESDTEALEEIVRKKRRTHPDAGSQGARGKKTTPLHEDPLLEAYRDGLRRLMLPSIERELHGELKEKSDIQAVTTFGRNLYQLLMTPPVTGWVILGVDPAFRTGCKLAVIDEYGKYLEHGVIYPVPPKNDYEGSKKTILDLYERYKIQGVAIGNGTGSRETQEFFARLNREEKIGLKYTVVSEAGASVYSASKIAQEEYPDLDVTIRGAISIAQRLQDPMAALVKVDPRSLGIGQYQHDVDQKLLDQTLHDTIEDLVNQVGVEVNSASAPLLSYVAGLGPKLTRAVVSHREKEGPFRTKKDLLKVKGMGARAFEQCAGFLRIRDGQSILDNTGVHPESYDIAGRLLSQDTLDLLKISSFQEIRAGHIKSLAKDWHVGEETLRDIVKELHKPGFDPREDLAEIPFREDVTDIHQLQPGAVVSGVVRNLTDFGAFVDIGLKNDGLIHISEMSEHRISHPLEILALNQYLPSVRVISVDADRGKVGLSLRDASPQSNH